MLLYYFFASLGLCFILKYATILNLLRNFLTSRYKFLKELFNCSMCLGFWCGVALVPFLWTEPNVTFVSILFPLASSSFCWSMDLILDAVVAFTNLAREERTEVSRKPL